MGDIFQFPLVDQSLILPTSEELLAGTNYDLWSPKVLKLIVFCPPAFPDHAKKKSLFFPNYLKHTTVASFYTFWLLWSKIIHEI